MARGALTVRAVLLVLLLAAVAVLSIVSGSDGQQPVPSPVVSVVPVPLLPSASGTMSDGDIKVAFTVVDARLQALQKDVTVIANALPKLQDDVISLRLWRSAAVAVTATLQVFLTLLVGWWLKRPPNGRPPLPPSGVPEPTPKRSNLFFGRERT